MSQQYDVFAVCLITLVEKFNSCSRLFLSSVHEENNVVKSKVYTYFVKVYFMSNSVS